MHQWQIDKTVALVDGWLAQACKKTKTPRAEDVALLDKIVRLRLELARAVPTLPVHPVDHGLIGAGVFAAQDYLDRYADLREQLGPHNYGGALEHWLDQGLDEGRQGCPAFSARWYLKHHGDLAGALGESGYREAAQHWLQSGIAEGRQGCAAFHVKAYLAHHEDLREAFGERGYAEAVFHWVFHGVSHRRRSLAE